MQRALQSALDRADDTVESVQRQPPRSRPSLSGEKSLHEKLYDIYLEECEKEPVVPELRSNVNLLEKLVRRESLPCLVVNVYPENEGYSLMLKDRNGSLSEAFQVACVKEQLLEYLDAKELPLGLIDVLEQAPVNVFQQGCVIAEIRDYRLCGSTEPAGYQSQHTLLRPTMQTLAHDVESIARGNSQCTQEEKLELESQMILATAEPLCLDPNVAVTLMSNRLLYNEQKMKTDSMRWCSKRHAWPSLDVQVQSTRTSLPDTKAMIVWKTETESKVDHLYDPAIPEAGMCVDMWKQESCELAVLSEVDVQKYAKGQPSLPCDDSKPAAGHLWPDPEGKHGCVFKCEDGSHLWEPMPGIMQLFNDPLFSTAVEPPVEGRCDSQMFLVILSPGSDGSMAGIKTEPGKAVDMFQEPVQSKAVYPRTMPQESSDLSSLGLPTPDMMAKTSLGPSSVLEEKEKFHASPVTLLSHTRQGSSGIKHRTLQVSRPRKLPRLAPAPPKPASQIHNAFGVVNMVGTLLLAAQPSGSSDPSSTTGMNILNLLGLPSGVPVLVSDSSQVLGSSTCTPSSTEIPPSKLPCKAQLRNAQSKAAQHPVNNSLQHIGNNSSCPITVKTTPGSVILHPQQQPQSQLQQEQPQQQLQVHMKPQQKTALQLQVNQLQLHKQPQSEPQQQVQLLLQPQQQPQLKLLLLQVQEQAQLQLLQSQQQAQLQLLLLQPQDQAQLQSQQQAHVQPQQQAQLQLLLRQEQAQLQPQQQAQLQMLQPQQQAQLQLLQPQQQAQLQSQQQAQLQMLQPQQQAQLQPQQQAQLQMLQQQLQAQLQLLQPQQQAQLQSHQQAQLQMLQPQQQAQLQSQQQAQLQMLQPQQQAQLQLLQPQQQAQLQPQQQAQLQMLQQQLQAQLQLLQPQQQAQLQSHQQAQLQMLQPQQQAQLQSQQQAQLQMLQPQQQAQLQSQQQAQLQMLQPQQQAQLQMLQPQQQAQLQSQQQAQLQMLQQQLQAQLQLLQPQQQAQLQSHQQAQLQMLQPQQQAQLQAQQQAQLQAQQQAQLQMLQPQQQAQLQAQQQAQLQLMKDLQQAKMQLLLLQPQEQAQLQLLLLQPQEQAQLQQLQSQQQAHLLILQPQQQAQGQLLLLQPQQQTQLQMLLLQPQQRAQLQAQQQAQLQWLLLQLQEQAQLQAHQQAQLQPQHQAQLQLLLLQPQEQAQLQAHQQSQLQPQHQAQLQLLLLQPQVQAQLQQLQPQEQAQLQSQEQAQLQLLLLQPQEQAQLQPQQQDPLQLLQPQEQAQLQPQQQAQLQLLLLQPQEQAQLQPQQQAQLQPQQQDQEQSQLLLQQWAELQLRQLESEQQGKSQLQQLEPEQQGQLHSRIYEQPQDRAQAHLQLLQQQVELLVQELQEEQELQQEQTEQLSLNALFLKESSQTPGDPPPQKSAPPTPAQGWSSQQWALPAQQACSLNFAGAREIQQSQAAVVCGVVSAQPIPRQNLPQQSFQLSAALMQHLPGQSQNM